MMANVDYVVVGPGPSLADVTDAVRKAIDATEIVDNRLHTSDERSELTVCPSANKDTLVEVYYAGDILVRRALSHRVYDYIVDHTDWGVVLESDDADGTIAARKSRAQSDTELPNTAPQR
jgi:hypothetical protein